MKKAYPTAAAQNTVEDDQASTFGPQNAGAAPLRGGRRCGPRRRLRDWSGTRARAGRRRRLGIGDGGEAWVPGAGALALPANASARRRWGRGHVWSRVGGSWAWAGTRRGRWLWARDGGDLGSAVDEDDLDGDGSCERLVVVLVLVASCSASLAHALLGIGGGRDGSRASRAEIVHTHLDVGLLMISRYR